MKPRRALFAVSDKTGVVEFARGLGEFGVELVATGRTAETLRNAGLPVREVSDVTGFPEILGGRVKTLHPKVHGGILYRRDDPGHRAEVEEHGIVPIDVVVVNLYPFESAAAREDADEADVIEEIDVGGPAMLRAAAKNHRHVAVVSSPDQYPWVLGALQAGRGSLSEADLREMAVAAFRRTTEYDAAIFGRLAGARGEGFPLSIGGHVKERELRYGENPHQRAAVYRDPSETEACVGTGRLVAGAPLSFNNYLDANAAFECVKEFANPACVVVKHATPCGAAVAGDAGDAYDRARACDPVSAFGGVVAFNRPVTAAVAERLVAPGGFLEAIVAPSFDDDATEKIARRSSWGAAVRLLATGAPGGRRREAFDVRSVTGGLLAQTRDLDLWSAAGLRVVTRRAPTDAEAKDLERALKVAKHVRSNAVVLLRDGAAVGIGGGQTSRLEAARQAVARAAERASGAAMASDGFFPFNDAIEVALDAGVTAVVQPGGSKNDARAIALCDERGVAMVFTDVRHFRH